MYNVGTMTEQYTSLNLEEIKKTVKLFVIRVDFFTWLKPTSIIVIILHHIYNCCNQKSTSHYATEQHQSTANQRLRLYFAHRTLTCVFSYLACVHWNGPIAKGKIFTVKSSETT